MMNIRIPVIVLLSGTDVNELFVKLGQLYHTNSSVLETLRNSNDNEQIDPTVRTLYRKTKVAMEACIIADHIVGLTSEMKDGFTYACQHIPISTLLSYSYTPLSTESLIKKFSIIRQGIIPPLFSLPEPEMNQLSPTTSSLFHTHSLRSHLGLPSRSYIILLICGLREVKDPFFIFPKFIEWINEQNYNNNNNCNNIPIYLVTIGPALVASVTKVMYEYTNAQCIENYSLFTEETNCQPSSSLSTNISSLPSIENYYGGKHHLYYHPSVDRNILLSYIQQSNLIINTSISEGESNAILEAMYIGTPVVARNNKGNQSIIEHNKNGYLFNTPEEAIHLCKQLYQFSYNYETYQYTSETNEEIKTLEKDSIEDPSLIIKNAYQYINTEHNLQTEKELWINVVKNVIQNL